MSRITRLTMIDIDLSPERLYSSSHKEGGSSENARKRLETGAVPSWRMKVSMGSTLGRQMVSITGLFGQLKQKIRA